MPATTAVPSRADALAAGEWLSTRVVRTPVIRSTTLDQLAGVRLWLKAENLQRSGSYKFRGATRAVGRLAESGASDGVIAQSTGNHAIAVAMAARDYGLAATVVLPVDAPPTKIALVEACGARVELVGTTAEERIEVVQRHHQATGHQPIDSYDHPDVVCGQATATLELIDEVRRQGGRLDSVIIPVGGGGGVAGACLVAGDEVRVYGVEPVGNDSLTQSLAAGERITVTPIPTLADGLRPTTVGEVPFQIARDALAGMLLVDDAEITRALCLALVHAKLLVEPAAAAALAAALQAAGTLGEDVGVMLTGGNVDPALVARLITERGAEVTL